MKPFKKIPVSIAKKLSYVLCDIDDTITSNGKLSAASYTALWKLKEAGFGVIPVTGRPAGWCDLIIRQWPVQAIIGENGAFVYHFKDGYLHTFTHPSVLENSQEKLAAVLDAALKDVPGCRVSRDQFSRIYDVAIDFREDPPYLTFEDAEKIKDICESMGAKAKVSSIHVNAWFGKYDKLSMTKLFMYEVLGESDIKDKIIFFGDSPNDEPMFDYFPITCAMANIKPFMKSIIHPPAYVTENEGGEGFTEAVNHLLSILS